MSAAIAPPAAHVLGPATPSAASEPGALSGHEVRCSCGFAARTSLSARQAQADAAAHLRWAERTGR